MQKNWNRDQWKKTNLPISQGREEWVWKPVKIDRRGSIYSPIGGGGATILRQQIYPCAFCQGVGEKPKGAKCPVCQGKGQVSVKPPVIRCAYCKGRGEERRASQLTCSVCRGKGFVSVTEPLRVCPHCRGTGAEPTNKLPCIVCGGKGAITVKQSPEEQTGARTIFPNTASRNSRTQKIVGPRGLPTGSESEVLEIVHRLGGTSKTAIGRRMGVSCAYAEHLCNSLTKSGYLFRVNRGIFALTEKGKKVVRKGKRV